MFSKQEQARDKRLRKTYGWSLEQINKLSEIQGHKCAICGRSFSEFNTSPNVDHRHFSVKAYRLMFGTTVYDKLIVRFLYNAPVGAKWAARVDEFDIWGYGKTKVEAVNEAKRLAKPLSVRGLLCPGRHGKAYHGCCNRNLGRVDDAKWLRAAADYLDDPPAKEILGPHGYARTSESQDMAGISKCLCGFTSASGLQEHFSSTSFSEESFKELEPTARIGVVGVHTTKRENT